MQTSQTYNYEKNDHINRADIALICSQYFGIKDVSSSLYQIAAPVSELAYSNKNGAKIRDRVEIEEAIPWNERSLKNFGVVYRYESTASFIGLDGKTYVVPNDQPVLEHLQECGYVIAQSGKNLDGSSNGEDSLILEEKDEFNIFSRVIADRRLPIEIVNKIDEIENNRPYYNFNQSYARLVRFGGTLGIFTASEEEIQQLSLSERKIANICTYGRITNSSSMDIEQYIQFALQQYYLNAKNFINSKKL